MTKLVLAIEVVVLRLLQAKLTDASPALQANHVRNSQLKLNCLRLKLPGVAKWLKHATTKTISSFIVSLKDVLLH